MKYTNQKMYNGHMITNTINKPLLHKKGKQWIVVGLSTLMLAGFGGAVGLGQSTVHADTNTVQTSINKNLAQNNKQSSSASSNNTQSSANASNSNKATSTSTSEVTDQAKNLHANLLANATLAPVTGTNDSANNGQKNNQANTNKQEEVVSEPEVGNASGTYEGMNYTSDGNGTVTFTGTLTGSASNHNPSDFFDEGKYEHSLPVNTVTQAKKIVFGTNSDPVDFSGQSTLEDMFDGASNNNIQEIDFNKVTGMDNITSMKQMFGGATTTNPNLKAIYLGKGFDMSNVTSDSDMFGTGQPVDTNHNITVSSLNTYGNLKPNVMSQVKIPSIPNMQTGNYDGLNYIYDPNTSTVMFTSGDLSWNKGVGTGGNYGNQDFIGSGDENPSESYGQDAPAFMNTVKHIVFRNVDLSKDIISDGGGQFGNARYMFANNPKVESIDLGPDFVNNKLHHNAGYTISNIFQSDTNLKSITIPNGFINGNDNAGGAFTNDNNLQQINILASPNGINGQTEFASNDGLTGNWRQGGKSLSNSAIINVPLQPGTYINESNEPKPFDFINFVHQYEPNSYPSDGSDHNVAIPDFVHDSFTEGTSTVKYNTDNDTITFSGGTLANNKDDNAHSSLAIPTRIKDNTTGMWVPSDLLPNDNKDWTIRFNNVTAPNSIYFDLDGKNEHESTYSGHQYASMTPSQREKKSRNFIGNQVSNIDLSGLNTNGTTNMEGFMINDANLKHVNFGNINTSNVTNMAMMLGSDVSLPYVDLSNLNGHSLNEAWDMLYNCRSLQGVKLSSQFSPHYQNNNPIKTNGNDTSDQGSDAVNLGEMFGSDPSLQFRNIDWNGFNTNKVTAFYGMFRSDYNLGKINLPASFDTSNGINFGHSIPQRSQEAKNTGPDGMFQSDFSTNDNKGVTSIDLGPSFDTSKATNIAAMFRADKALKTIKFGNKFNTSNVNNMQQMFAYSDGISDLSLPALFNTKSVTNNTSMFQSDAIVTKDRNHQVQPHSGKLTTIIINSPNTKLNDSKRVTINGAQYNMWGYWSDYQGNIDNVDPNRYFKETGMEDSSDKPTTINTRNDFSKGNVGVFTLKNLNPGTKIIPQTSDTIIFSDVDPSDSRDGANFSLNVFGQKNVQKNVNGWIPKGFNLQLTSNHPYPYFTFDNGVHHFNIVSSKKPGTNIPVLENSVDVQGTIKLVFNKGHNEHDIYLPYSEQQRFSDGSRNILNNAEITANDPTGYLNRNIKDFNTTGYHYDNNVNPSDYNFTPNANEAIYNNGSTPLIRHDVELDYSGDNDTETVNFIYTDPFGKQSTIKTDSISNGTNGEQASDNNIPNGYYKDPNSSTKYIFENGGTHVINVIPKRVNATVKYMSNGTQVGSATLSGNNSSDKDIHNNPISDTSTNITNVYHPGLPAGYSVNGSTTVNFNNGTYTINVKQASDTDEVIFRGDNNSDYSVSGSKGTLETVNVPAHFHFVGNNSSDNQNGFINGNHQGQFNLDGGHHYFDVARNLDTMNITFSDGHGNLTPSRQDTGLSDTSDVVVAPDNYHFSDGHGHSSKSTVIKYNNGNYDHNPLHIVGDKVNDDIAYIDHAGNYIKDNTVSGAYGSNDGNDINSNKPNNYKVISGTSFTFDGGTHIVKVVGNKTDNIIYLDAQGNVHGSTSQSGASDASDDINSGNKSGLSDGYQLVNGDNKFAYNGLTHVVPVKGVNESVNIQVTVHQIVNGNSDGNKTITLTRLGNVGSDVTVKPDDTDVINNSTLPSNYLKGLIPDGRDYPRVGKFTASDKVSGINSPINFYYDRNSTNANAITVNYRLNSTDGKIISHGSFSKPKGNQGYVTSDVSVPAGYSRDGNPNTHYVATNDPQTFNIPVVAKQANLLPGDTNQGKVRLNLIFKDNNGKVQKVVTHYSDLTNRVGSDFTISVPTESGYQPTNSDSPFSGKIYSYGAFPDTHTFDYQANPASTTVHFNNQNGSDVTPADANNNANGYTNGPANIALPAGYRLPIGTNYHFNSDNQLVDSNNQPASNPLQVVGDKIVGNAKLHLIYKDGSNVSDETATVPISGEVGGTATINPYNYLRDNYQLNTSKYDGTGLAGRLTVNFTPSDVTNSDQHGFAYDPVYTFEYDSTAKKLTKDVYVAYINVNNGNKLVYNSPSNKLSDLGKFPNNSIGDTVLLAAKNTGVNNDKYYYDLTVPNGYHLEHTYNPITLTDDPAHAQATATRLGISIPSNVGMLLTVNLASTGAKPNKPTSSSADNHNHKPAKPSSSSASSSNSVPNKPAKPASSSASSSNNVPTPPSNSNSGGSVSPASNGGGFIPNGGGYIPIPIPYPTPTPASNADNTPHNSTTVLPGSTTNNYYDNDNNTTNNYYNNRSSKSSDFSSEHKIGKANNLRDLNEVGVNHSVYYHGYKITRLNVPARFRWIYIVKTCLAHKDLVNYGDHQYWAVLRPNHRITLRINKVFKTQRGKKTYYNYEVRIGRHNAFVTSYSTYTRNAYYQPTDLRRTSSHGIFHHYYRARLILNNGLYRSRYYTGRTFVRELHRGKIVHIKRIITIGRKGDFQTRFQLTNGDYITSNKNWIKLL